eukprot:2175653-Prymnesium_polylepis.1
MPAVEHGERLSGYSGLRAGRPGQHQPHNLWFDPCWRTELRWRQKLIATVNELQAHHIPATAGADRRPRSSDLLAGRLRYTNCCPWRSSPNSADCVLSCGLGFDPGHHTCGCRRPSNVQTVRSFLNVHLVPVLSRRCLG